MVRGAGAGVIAHGRHVRVSRPTSETTATRAAGTLGDVRIQNAQRVSEAIQTLSAGTSLDTLVDRLYDLTDGTLALDRATLHRIARGGIAAGAARRRAPARSTHPRSASAST